MEALLLGAFSGNVDLYAGNDYLAASLTSYTPDGFNDQWHAHENAHLSFLLNGGCLERKKEPYGILPGMITYYSAGEFHQVCSVAGPTRRVNIELTPFFFREHGLADQMIRGAINRNPDIKFLMVKMCHELLLNDGFSPTSIEMLLLELLLRAKKQTSRHIQPGWVKVIYEYLNEAFTDKVTLQDLSLIAGVGPVTVSRYFPAYFGCTLGEYIRKLRIQKALGMLKSPSLTMTEIALECGFFDQSHFIRTFKQIHGILPMSYRKL